MNSVRTFQFESHDVRVVMDEQSNYWFIGRDICLAHALKNPNRKMSNLWKTAIPKHKLIKDKMGRNQDVRVLTLEETLELINSMRVSVPKFELWLINELMPQLQEILTKMNRE
jgi:prophage antirepressor-like protein